ncbi:2-dehydro-3-deoxy-D-gluconate 5-dehydrogenase [Planococcus massiliensis]|uniref:2-dehydro-3-deoxy-D-gluconate 5-dehydrogenase n=1 Tax=Planococcus massiliensis TaxID=1499687 RepID=A0A098EH46_9BACL|nr:SDR family oxidoreductase [Planococcus massiliensis]CEG21619.1 2-dehydro-3-deoxy-D-gluconate 5-dehydrogenase [Planococcus massiliensis]
MPKTIFITGAGSGLGKGAAFGLAEKGHRVIAPVETAPQVTALREEAKAAGIELEVFKMDIKNPQDLAQMLDYDFDIFVANAAVNEGGPLGEVPMSNFRELFEVNVFSTLETAQIAAQKFVAKGEGKIIFMSSMAGIMATPYVGPYTATKHAIEAIATTMQKELEGFGVKVATINPGAFATGFNDRSAEAKWKWYDEKIHFTKKEDMEEADKALEDQYDPADMIAKMVEVIPLDSHKFRTAYPEETEQQMKEEEAKRWEMDI